METRLPAKQISTQEDFEKWKQSSVYKSFLSFVLELSDAVKGKAASVDLAVSPACASIISLLDRLEEFAEATPPISQSNRFGNKAFRTWFALVEEHSQELMRPLLAEDQSGLAAELSAYLVGSIGNATRIDYGTGHEASFVLWLMALRKVGVLSAEDSEALVLRVFVRYLRLVRRVQRLYWLEPAGSHGVWGLDDHQFLPFLWGASQLVDHPTLKPSTIRNRQLVEHHAADFLFLDAVRFVYEVKSGPFSEHSPYLAGLADLPHQLWSKVSSGMVKAYKAEVLEKFPVVQHFLFGSLLPFE
eukprot:TRINITY_DN3028_c0_g1_i1.p1 TRINITY_DN3028_c0_g1~~TRINITY_DN3028_c0_g1_i1.p1  ORF type:complete len:301 (-),score=35.73 TRINITY_DN3028_c0_g1_i1:139-1041(-)